MARPRLASARTKVKISSLAAKDPANQTKPASTAAAAEAAESSEAASASALDDKAAVNSGGRKRAVLIGCNYINSSCGQLTGCDTDVDIMKAMLMEYYGYKEDDIICMRDVGTSKDDPTYPSGDNIIKTLCRVVAESKAHDSITVTFSGHGGSITDQDGDDDSGQDQTICPADTDENGVIVDDTLNEILVQELPRGVRLTALFDSCRSGTVCDLPITYHVTGKYKKLKVQAEKLNGSDESVKFVDSGLQFKGHKYSDVIQFSGCQDDELSQVDYSTNEYPAGALTRAFARIVVETKGNVSYIEMMRKLRSELYTSDFKQTPQMSTSRKFDLTQPLQF
ncbi:peptidase C14 [Ramicandelaber brevisporus]|nr:peptidase C14 [Ramicandelaber brevisporus]